MIDCSTATSPGTKSVKGCRSRTLHFNNAFMFRKLEFFEVFQMRMRRYKTDHGWAVHPFKTECLSSPTVCDTVGRRRTVVNNAFLYAPHKIRAREFFLSYFLALVPTSDLRISESIRFRRVCCCGCRMGTIRRTCPIVIYIRFARAARSRPSRYLSRSR